MLVDAGLDVVAEHGHHAGEVRGLEVARVSRRGPARGRRREADRELTALVHARTAPRSRARAGRRHRPRRTRRPGAARHPLNQLVPERWLRWTVCHHPDAGRSRPARPGRRHPCRAEACASDDVAVADRAGHVVVCSVGVDFDLVPAAADARLVIDPDAELVLVVPERDDHPPRVRWPPRCAVPPTCVRSSATGARSLSHHVGAPQRPGAGVRRCRGALSPTLTCSRTRRATPSWRGGTRSWKRSSRVPRDLRARTEDLEAAKQMLSDSTGDDREFARAEVEEAGRRDRPARGRAEAAAAAEGSERRSQRHRGDPRCRRRRGGQPLRPRPLPDVPGLSPSGWDGSSRCWAPTSRHGWLQRDHVPAVAATACGRG